MRPIQTSGAFSAAYIAFAVGEDVDEVRRHLRGLLSVGVVERVDDPLASEDVWRLR